MRKLLLIAAALFCMGIQGRQPEVETDVDALIQAAGPTFDFDASTAFMEQAPDNCYGLNDSAASTVVVNKCGGAAGTASANTADWDAASGSCKVGTCLLFAVASSHLIDAGSDIIGTGADSVCAWVNPTSVDVGVNQYFAANGKFIFYLFDADNNKVLLSSDGGVTAATSASALVAGTWYHICGTRSAAGLGNIYINGALNGAADQNTGTPEAGTGNVIIGNRAAADRDFGGYMDDVRHYSRVLSPNEVQAIYAKGVGHERLDTGAHKSTLVTDATGAVAAVVNRGIEFYQSTAANRPTLSTLNGRRVLSFDGNDVLDTNSNSSLSSVILANGGTIIAVAQPTALGADNEWVFTGASNVSLGTSTDPNTTRFTINDGGWKVLYGTAPAANTRLLLTAALDGTQLRLRQNGVATFLSAGNPSGAYYTAQELNIGGNATSANGYWTGPIARVTIFNKNLPNSVLLPIERGLAARYGVSLASAAAEQGCDAYIASLTPTLWLEADDLSTITKDGSNKVSAWASKVGSVTFTQATADNQPTWTGQGVDFTNGPSMTSSSTTDTLFANNAKTVMYVANCDNLANGDTFIRDTDVYFDAYINATPKMAFINYDGSTDTCTSSLPSTGANFIFEATHDTGNITAWTNGAGSDGAVASGNTSNLTKTLQLGVDADCRIITMLVDDSVWDSSTRARVRSCLGQRYGVTF